MSRQSDSTRKPATPSGNTCGALRKEIGITVFMTTHYLDEAENCDRIAIIDQGKIQAVDTPAVAAPAGATSSS